MATMERAKTAVKNRVSEEKKSYQWKKATHTRNLAEEQLGSSKGRVAACVLF